MIEEGLLHTAATWVGLCAMFGSGCSSASHDPTSDAGVSDATVSDVSSGEGSAQTSKGDASDGDAADDASYADAGGCHPIDISGFDAATTVPTAPRSLACNGFNGDGGIVPSFGDACLFHSPEYPPCASFDVGDAAGAAECYGCLVSPPTADGTFSSVVAILSGVATINYASCIQLADPTEAGAACALDLQTAVACIFYACQSTCPVTDEALSLIHI